MQLIGGNEGGLSHGNSKLSALIIEDKPVVAQLVLHTLKRMGISNITIVDSLSQAENLLSHNMYDILISDNDFLLTQESKTYTPNLGVSLLERLDLILPKISVLFSGNNTDDLINRAKNSGIKLIDKAHRSELASYIEAKITELDQNHRLTNPNSSRMPSDGVILSR